MEKIHQSTEINKAVFKLPNGQSMYIVSEDINDFSQTFERKQTENVPKTFSCVTCKKSFETEELVEKHVANCNYCCDICQKGLKKSKYLNSHIKLVHNQDKPKIN